MASLSTSITIIGILVVGVIVALLVMAGFGRTGVPSASTPSPTILERPLPSSQVLDSQDY